MGTQRLTVSRELSVSSVVRRDNYKPDASANGPAYNKDPASECEQKFSCTQCTIRDSRKVGCGGTSHQQTKLWEDQGGWMIRKRRRQHGYQDVLLTKYAIPGVCEELEVDIQ